jgi:hypothetical protein
MGRRTHPRALRLHLRLVAGGYQLITKPEHHVELETLFADLLEPAPLRLSESIS